MDKLKEYDLNINEKSIKENVRLFTEKAKVLDSLEIRKKIFSLIDLTTFEVSDNDEKITSMVKKLTIL